MSLALCLFSVIFCDSSTVMKTTRSPLKKKKKTFNVCVELSPFFLRSCYYLYASKSSLRIHVLSVLSWPLFLNLSSELHQVTSGCIIDLVLSTIYWTEQLRAYGIEILHWIQWFPIYVLEKWSLGVTSLGTFAPDRSSISFRMLLMCINTVLVLFQVLAGEFNSGLIITNVPYLLSLTRWWKCDL